ncbi:MAG: pentapeptide repeat-containing protein [Pseudomonadota bacterium]
MSPPPTPTDTLDDTEATALARIERISLNTRSAWFGLLALLGFVGVTLLGHRDADFFLSQKNTDLPLLNVAVPVEAFFYTAPVLVAAVYAYLHLSLLALWDALADAPPTAGGRPLADRAFPWLLNAWALGRRRAARWHEDPTTRAKLRHPDAAPCIAPRPLAAVSAAVTLFLAWGFGPLVLAYGWWRSMPAHDFWLTMTSGSALAVAVVTGIIGYRSARDRLAGHPAETVARRPWAAPLATLLAALALTTLLRTGDDPTGAVPETIERVIRDGIVVTVRGHDFGRRWHYRYSLMSVANLEEIAFVEHPEDWRPFDLWLEDYRRKNGSWDESADSLVPSAREMERYALWLGRIPAVPLKERDLSRASLRRATLSSVDLRRTVLRKGDLYEAELQGAHLSDADLQAATFIYAQMQGADLRDAIAQGASFLGASLQGATLIGANLQQADLSSASMQGAILRGTELQRAVLISAKMQEADLSGANMQAADLPAAKMHGADLTGANLRGADLDDATLNGAQLSYAEMGGADLGSARMQYAELSYARLQGAGLLSLQMQNAQCTGIDLSGSLLHHANLLCIDLAQREIAFSTGDSETRLPIGVSTFTCIEDPESKIPESIIFEYEQSIIADLEVNYQLGRQVFFDFISCNRKHERSSMRRPFRLEGVWEAMGDGRWRNYVTGVIHAEGVEDDGGWGDIPVPWVTPPDAPPPEGRPFH